MNKYEISNQGTTYQSLSVKGKWTDINFSSVDKDGGLEIEVCDGNKCHHIYINQQGINMLIEHLQKQLK